VTPVKSRYNSPSRLPHSKLAFDGTPQTGSRRPVSSNGLLFRRDDSPWRCPAHWKSRLNSRLSLGGVARRYRTNVDRILILVFALDSILMILFSFPSVNRGCPLVQHPFLCCIGSRFERRSDGPLIRKEKQSHGASFLVDGCFHSSWIGKRCQEWFLDKARVTR